MKRQPVQVVICIIVGFMLSWAQDKEEARIKAQPPAISDAQKLKIREFQLLDVRMADAIKQKQMEIAGLQQQAISNAKQFDDYVKTVCKAPFVFDMSSSENLRCIPKPEEKTAAPPVSNGAHPPPGKK